LFGMHCPLYSTEVTQCWPITDPESNR